MCCILENLTLFLLDSFPEYHSRHVPFYEARNISKCNRSKTLEQLKIMSSFTTQEDAIMHCKCLSLCDVTEEAITHDQIPYDDDSILEVFVVNSYVRTLQERFSYDIIFLLCDIGGNMGLYFGMSCLTLVEIFVHCSKLPCINFKKTTTANSKMRNKIQTILEKNQKEKKQSFPKKILKISIKLFLVLISLYYIYNLIDSYLQYPLFKTVSLIRDPIIQFPLIIVCGESSEITNAKRNLAKQLNSNCELLQFVDLLHKSSQFANKPLQLWEASTLMYKQLQRSKKD
uniref:Uncharacterized protein n=1 Tax=Strigamia maritima TaxID=126957 RepID=T1JF29_STRMM